jgi:radical SAM superfamily enzyme YgiQ (UPF0313 family)
MKNNINIALVGINYRSEDPKYDFFSITPHILKACLLNSIYKDNIYTFQFYNDDILKKISKKILACNPTIVGFSSYIWNLETIKKISKILKNHNKEILIVLGGPHVNQGKELILNDRSIDLIVNGEGEITIIELVKSYTKYLKNNSKINFKNSNNIKNIKGISFKNKNQIISTKRNNLVDLNNIPSYILNRDLFKEALMNKEHAIAYETSRGCPFSCNYCVWGKTKIRTFSIDRIKNELNVLLKYKNIKRIYFTDANLFHNEKRAIEIIKFLSKKNHYNIPVHFELNPQFITNKLIRTMKKFHYGIYDFGIQTLNPNALKLLNRNLNYNIINKKLKLLNNLNDLDIRINIIYGLPGDDINGFIQTLNNLIKLKPTRITINKLLLLPGSEFYKNPKKYGIYVNSNNKYILNYTDSFTKIQMKKAAKISFYINLYFGNKILQIGLSWLLKFRKYWHKQKNISFVKIIENYFDYINNKTNFMNNFTFEDLEESSPEKNKIKNYEKIIKNISKIKLKIYYYSMIFFIKTLFNPIN